MGAASYAIEKESLVRFPLFKWEGAPDSDMYQEISESNVWKYYNFFNHDSGITYDNSPRIHLSDDKINLCVPFTNEHDGLTRSYAIYNVDGNSVVLRKKRN